MAESQRTLFIACGALAREFLAVSKASGWDDRVEITCLPAIWHNRPDKIPEGVRRKIRQGRKRFEHRNTRSARYHFYTRRSHASSLP